MNMNILEKITKDISLESGYTKDQEEQVKYTIRILFFEIIKTIFLLLVFKITGHFNEGITLLICMILTKPFIGGYHEKTQIRCFISTLIIAGGIILLASKSELDFVGMIILNLTSLFIVYQRAPIINEDMPISKIELINKNRKIAIIMTVFLLILALGMFKRGEYSEVITWTMIIDASLMFNKRVN